MKRLGIFVFGLLVICMIMSTVQAAAPAFDSFAPPSDPSSYEGVTQDFSVDTNQTMNFTWYIDTVQDGSTSSATTSLYSNNTATVGEHNVTVVAINVNGTISKMWTWTVETPPAPSINSPDPSGTSVTTYNGSSQTFSINIDQTVNVTWYRETILVQTDNSVSSSSYTNTSPIGTYNITVNVENQNGTDSMTWDWSVIEIPPPSITPDPLDEPQSQLGDDQVFTITTDQPVNITWLMNGTEIKNETLNTSSTYSNNTAPIGTYNITVNVENVNGTNTTTWIWSVVPIPVVISNPDPSSSTPSTIEDETITFSIEIDQGCEVRWYIDGDLKQTNNSPVTSASFTTSKSSADTYIVEVVAENLTTSAYDSHTWTWKVNSKTYYSGNRIWDESMSPIYTWNPQSFSGFYYNLDTDEGKETLTITDIDRSIGRNDIEYKTEPIEVDFEKSALGDYYVIGFMADRYFAGYTDNTAFASSSDSLLDEEQLSRVLIDSDDGYMVKTGSPLELEEGYDFRVTEYGASGDDVMVGLFKDGRKVHETILSEGDIYVYEKDLGSVDNIPIIAIRIQTVFRGMETSTVKVEGIFQISEDYIEVERNDEFGLMEIDTVNANQIIMHNDNTVYLKKGKTFNLMGKINIQVADDDDIRFAPVVDMSEPGTYELRGTVTDAASFSWTPLNFEGMLYDIDSGEGDETLSITRDDSGDRSISAGDLTYTTQPIAVDFDYSSLGQYDSIGFMGEKYFAGYRASGVVGGAISLMEKGRLGKILLDENDKHTLHLGNSLPLEEGYSLRIDEISRSGDAIMVTLFKDGKPIRTDITSEGEPYLYTVEVDKEEIPIIVVNIDQVFMGMETNSIFIKGIFQISEDFKVVEEDDTYGEMVVETVTDTKITMENEDSISLSKGSTIDIMGDISIKVADDSDVRFYPFQEIVVEEPLFLELDIPDSVYENEEVTITVTSDGDEVKDASITFGDAEIGSTDSDGELVYIPTETGTFTVTATKSGYVSDDAEIEVLYQPKVLEVAAPLVVDRGESIVISVTSEGSGVSGVSVKFGSNDLGTTPSSGNITYTPDEVGTFTITASKTGYQDASKDIDITDPGAKLVFSNLTIKPKRVQPDEMVNITVEAANFGTLREAQTMSLRVNGKEEVSRDLVLGPGEIVTIVFTMNKSKPGTYLVEVDGRSDTFKVLGSQISSSVVIVIAIMVILSTTAVVYSIAQGTLSFDIIATKAHAFEKMLKRLFEK